MSDDDKTVPLDTDNAPQWVYVQTPKKKRGKGWLIASVVVLALIIAAVVFFWLRGGSGSQPAATPGTTPSATTTPAATPSAEPSASASATPSATPLPDGTATPPATEAPDVSDFAASVSNWLADATTGLGMIERFEASEGVGIADDLIGDAQRLSDAQPPTSISAAWATATDEYLTSLTTLKTVLSNGEDKATALSDSREKLATLNDLVGL